MVGRLDTELVNRGLVESREKGKALIMAGVVYIDGQKAFKAGDKVKEGASIEVRSPGMPYVSRGGYKLEKSLEVFPIDLTDKTCADIGASTGGFTDCMLQNGARKVYSIDVGYGQLAWKLRNDERVVNMERTNVRYLDFSLVEDSIEFISIDVSFISLRLVLPVAFELLSPGGELVALIKPQFEAGREQVGKKGVVRDAAVHQSVIESICDFAQETGFSLEGLDFSPIKGPEGNIEYLLYLAKDGSNTGFDQNVSIVTIVDKSHEM